MPQPLFHSDTEAWHCRRQGKLFLIGRAGFLLHPAAGWLLLPRRAADPRSVAFFVGTLKAPCMNHNSGQVLLLLQLV